VKPPHALSLAVRAADVPAEGRRVELKPDAAGRRALAEQLGIPEVTELVADFTVYPLGADTYSVRGSVAATVVQTDVVTLEPVQQRVEETIDLTFAAAEAASAERAAQALGEPGEDSGPELFCNGRIELGALTQEYLALGLDPYPRAPGVEFGAHIEDDSATEASHFAALAKLKKDEE
jgi:uncharacterized metal-binding protein YceD (DUF177 family)